MNGVQCLENGVQCLENGVRCLEDGDLVENFKSQVNKDTEKYRRLKDLDLFVLDNSI